jgi:hypothetical protein
MIFDVSHRTTYVYSKPVKPRDSAYIVTVC